jgi:hypothetical protein
MCMHKLLVIIAALLSGRATITFGKQSDNAHQ